MSEQENISTSEPKDEDVEAHKKKTALTDEPKAEGESDDDVELHKKKMV